MGLTITAGNDNGTSNGAGLSSTGANTFVTACTFTNNTTTTTLGGGAFFNNTGVTLTDCTFTGNVAAIGGGVHFFNATGATLTGCTFTGNEAKDGGGAYFVGKATITNGVFANNTASHNGGGIRLRAGGTVINSTFYRNTARNQGGGIAVVFNDADLFADGIQIFPFTLQNSLLVGNMAADVVSAHQVYVANADADEVNIQHNLIAGGADHASTGQGAVYVTPMLRASWRPTR